MPVSILCYVTGPLQENSYIVIDEATSACAVVDPGMDILAHWQELQEERKELHLDAIFLTHAHLDHIFGMKELKEATGAPIWMHEEDVFLIEEYVPFAGRWGFSVEQAPWPDKHWVDGQKVSLGESEFEIIHTPGHTPGGCCIRCGDDMFTGDTLMNYSIGRSDFPRGDHNALVSSILKKLYTLPESVTIHPGHMDPTTIGEEKRMNNFVRG